MSKIHYHGSPIWGGDSVISALYKERCALVSFARPDQIKKIAPICKSLVLDNGAFSRWKKEQKTGVKENWDSWWTLYYAFVLAWYSRIDWFIVPDVIEGSEKENDEMIDKIPSSLRDKAVPVWHSVESIERLVRLCEKFPRVAIGMCGPHEHIRTQAAQDRLTEAFKAIYVERQIDVKIHGLRMLDGRVLGKFPFDSADSTNVAINVPKWIIKYPEIGSHIIERWHHDMGYKFDGIKSLSKSNYLTELKSDKSTITELKIYRTAVLSAAIEQVMPPKIGDWSYENGDIHLLLL